jgi:membrane protease YdiL (CAAX protease family)
VTFAYHRLGRSAPKYAWWKALVTGLIAFALYLALALIATVALLVAALLDPTGVGVDFDLLVVDRVLDMSSPLILAFALGSVALMLPAIILARLIMGPRPLGLISSVTGRLRWRWMLRLALPTLLVFALSFAVYVLAFPLAAGEQIVAPQVTAATWALLVVTILFVPLQATAEEYVFRGYLMQTIGGWLRHPAWAILLPIPLFMAGHIYDIWGLLDVGVFALWAGWITWRTGGLEAAIVAHVINNGGLFVMSAFGLVDPNLAEGSPVGVLTTALTLALVSWFVLRLSKTGGADGGPVQRERTAEALVESQPQNPPAFVG